MGFCVCGLGLVVVCVVLLARGFCWWYSCFEFGVFCLCGFDVLCLFGFPYLWVLFVIVTLGVSIWFIGFGVRADWLVLRLFRFVACLLEFGLDWCFYWFGLVVVMLVLAVLGCLLVVLRAFVVCFVRCLF